MRKTSSTWVSSSLSGVSYNRHSKIKKPDININIHCCATVVQREVTHLHILLSPSPYTCMPMHTTHTHTHTHTHDAHTHTHRPPSPQLCAAEGCSNVKRYSDSVTNLPLCSLKCYKKLRTTSRMHHTQTLTV